MNKDHIKGRVEQAKGNLKKASGRIVGNDRLQTQGMADQLKGAVQAGYGDAKQNTKDMAQHLVDNI